MGGWLSRKGRGKGDPFNPGSGAPSKASDFISASAGAAYTWGSKQGSLKRFGDDQNNISFGQYGFSATSGLTVDKSGARLDVVQADVHAEAIAVSGTKDLGGGSSVTGAAVVASVDANADVGAEWTSDAKDLQAKVGASADLVKASIGAQRVFHLFGHELTVGGGAEGAIGAAAEAVGEAGWTKDKGFSLGAHAKAGLGLGFGLDFSLSFK